MDSNSISTVIGTDTTVTIEIIKALPMVVASVAAFVASIVAIYGINTWRREFIGKRRIELAEDVLALFYEVRDAIAGIRNPFSFEGEGSTRKTAEHETPEQKKARDQAHIVFERYNKREEAFSKLYSMRYRFMAQIGKDKAQPFDEIHKIIIEIFSAARTLAELWALRSEYYTPERQQQTHNDRKKYEEIIGWVKSEKDEIAKRVDEAVSEIDTICKGVILGKSTEQES